MSFSIPHRVINHLIPAKSSTEPGDWIGLVERADQINMDRAGRYQSNCTQNNRAADEYEGTWLKKWVDGSGAQRLHPKEQALVPLFHDLTRPLEPQEIAKSGFAFPPVPWAQIDGEHQGVDLKALARRIAETNYEANDGDPTMVAFKALADAPQAHTEKELQAINVILSRYFSRNVSFNAHENPAAGVSAAFEATERPYAITREREGRSQFHTKRELLKLNVKAPVDARVSVVPINRGDRFLDGLLQADVGPNGEVSFDISKLPAETAKVALYVVHDEDGAGPKPPVARSRVSIPLPWNEFHWNVDNTERTERLKSGRPEA